MTEGQKKQEEVTVLKKITIFGEHANFELEVYKRGQKKPGIRMMKRHSDDKQTKCHAMPIDKADEFARAFRTIFSEYNHLS